MAAVESHAEQQVAGVPVDARRLLPRPQVTHKPGVLVNRLLHEGENGAGLVEGGDILKTGVLSWRALLAVLQRPCCPRCRSGSAANGAESSSPGRPPCAALVQGLARPVAAAVGGLVDRVQPLAGQA